jgi:phage regulator Rha-like protein
MANQDEQPRRSSATASFDELRKEIAQRNEQAQQKARKARAVRDRAQILARRERERSLTDAQRAV